MVSAEVDSDINGKRDALIVLGSLTNGDSDARNAYFAAKYMLRLMASFRDADDLKDELADLYEVIDSLAELHNISKDEIIAAQTKKLQERGGFSGRRFVDVSEHPVGSFGEKYCLADPEKYPEIISEQ